AAAPHAPGEWELRRDRQATTCRIDRARRRRPAARAARHSQGHIWRLLRPTSQYRADSNIKIWVEQRAARAHLSDASKLEHVPSQLNQGDSLRAKDERVYRH